MLERKKERKKTRALWEWEATAVLNGGIRTDSYDEIWAKAVRKCVLSLYQGRPKGTARGEPPVAAVCPECLRPT